MATTTTSGKDSQPTNERPPPTQGREHAGTPRLDQPLLVAQFQRATKRLFMFDYDGTLTPIVQDPQAAIPSEEVLHTIRALAGDARNTVWIISGRDQDFLSRYLGSISELGLSAEHGSFVREPHSRDWRNLAEHSDMSWQGEVMEIFREYTEQTTGSFIERKRIALTWHYRLADPDLGVRNAQRCRESLQAKIDKRWDVDVMSGKANLEVRPSFVNKGEIAKTLVQRQRQGDAKAGDHLSNLILCMGDDLTDEDMFRTLHALTPSDADKDRIFTVAIGPSTKVTSASWHLPEPADVIQTIGVLANA